MSLACLQLLLDHPLQLHVFTISNQLNFWNQVKYSPLTSHLQVIPNINTQLCLLNGKGEYQRHVGKWCHLGIDPNAALRDGDRLERVLTEILKCVKVDWSKFGLVF